MASRRLTCTNPDLDSSKIRGGMFDERHVLSSLNMRTGRSIRGCQLAASLPARGEKEGVPGTRWTQRCGFFFVFHFCLFLTGSLFAFSFF